ncbi:hypothetical protein [Sphingomonas hylomeconis]|uniref:Uncharacterized protein n=1 Tax=Sphingomonas hylomeconis TaxID=1395958 RepID=A0ABV7SW03_9SPHN|nr:hypothetical protein [Sphingomonas hylomeconis]
MGEIALNGINNTISQISHLSLMNERPIMEQRYSEPGVCKWAKAAEHASECVGS